MLRIPASPLAYRYDAGLDPVAEVDPGAVLVVETTDARDGALSHHRAGSLFPLPRPIPGRGNPLTGPIAVRGCEPGDALRVEILDVACRSVGWTGGHAHVGPLAPGRVREALGRSCAVADGVVDYGAGIAVPARPMVGCVGTAPPGEPPGAGQPGRFGGNVDHPIIGAGSEVWLPVTFAGAYLFLGDVHAAQGDGELSGTALEIGGEVTVRLSVVASAALEWPWVRTESRLAVLTADREFAVARREAVEAMVSLIERRLGLAPADALALVSVAGDLRIGQAFGGMDLTLRLEMDRLEGLDLVPAIETGEA